MPPSGPSLSQRWARIQPLKLNVNMSATAIFDCKALPPAFRFIRIASRQSKTGSPKLASESPVLVSL